MSFHSARITAARAALPIAVLTVALLGFGATSALANNGATKTDLLRSASGNCGVGAFAGTVNASFAIINFSNDGSVSAEVAVKGGPANATLNVSLVQTPSGENCFGSEALLVTDGDGNGNVHIKEPLLPGTTGAFVIINGGFYATAGVAKN